MWTMRSSFACYLYYIVVMTIASQGVKAQYGKFDFIIDYRLGIV